MEDTESSRISELIGLPSAMESLESCSAIADARVFVLDPSGRVVASSEPRGCSCALCSDPPDHIDNATPTRAEIRSAGSLLGQVCCCGKATPAREAVRWLARELGTKATDHGDLESLSEELLSKYEEINLVYDFSASISSVFDENRVAELVLEKIMKTIRADRGVAMLTGQKNGELRTAASAGIPAGQLANAGTLFQTGAYERVARTAKAEVIDAQGEAKHSSAPLLCPPLVCSPLIANADVIGVISLFRNEDAGNFTSGDLKLLNAIASQLGTAIHNARLIEEAKKQERLRRELEIAASIQASLLPGAPPTVAPVEICARNIAAERVGGDYYSFFDEAEDQFSLVIADVSGHSIAAALMAANLRSVVRAAKVDHASPAEFMRRVNRMIYPDLERASMLVSMFYADYDGSSHRLRFANAGHNRPIFCSDSVSALMEAPGMLLGVLEDVEFAEDEVELLPEDTVLFYTDGLVEAENNSREPYGEERLKDVVQQNASGALERLLDACLDDVRRYAGRQSLYDDVTMIVIRQR